MNAEPSGETLTIKDPGQTTLIETDEAGVAQSALDPIKALVCLIILMGVAMLLGLGVCIVQALKGLP